MLILGCGPFDVELAVDGADDVKGMSIFFGGLSMRGEGQNMSSPWRSRGFTFSRESHSVTVLMR